VDAAGLCRLTVSSSSLAARPRRRGLTNEEIAHRLYLSPATARTHVSRILTKLDARNRAQLVVLAYETGLARPGWTT
jgi:DNA-binding NarL/FixJ family response regulator